MRTDSGVLPNWIQRAQLAAEGGDSLQQDAPELHKRVVIVCELLQFQLVHKDAEIGEGAGCGSGGHWNSNFIDARGWTEEVAQFETNGVCNVVRTMDYTDAMTAEERLRTERNFP